MADNKTVDISVGTADIATDEIGGVDYPRVKLSWGADGSAADVSEADPLPVRSFPVEVALGNVTGFSAVSKFGEATDCDNGVATDIWDGADGTTSTDVWVAPTTARTHDIASTSTADDGSPAGTGMRTVRIYGLTAWGSAEVSEDVTLDGTTNVATSNSYVIIHRMVGLTFGSGGTNAGVITATAQTDATVTAAIEAGEGQTLMAIYGVPSTQKFICTRFGVEIAKGGTTIKGTVRLLVKENADQADAGFVTKHKASVSSDDGFHEEFDPPINYAGPCIIKLQIATDTNNSTTTAEFGGYVVDN